MSKQSHRPSRRNRPILKDRTKPFNHLRMSGTIKLTSSKKGIRTIDSARSKYPKVVKTVEA